MNVIDLLRGNFQRHVQGTWTPVSADKPWRKSTWWTGTQTAAGIRVDEDSALNSSAAFACTRALAETLASLPAVVYEGLEGDQRKKARQNSMWALIHDQPNPQMDSMTWFSLNAKRLVNRGNCLNLIEFNGRGIPVALWPVHNSRWEARRRPSAQTAGGRWIPGDVYYRIWPDDSERHFDVGSDEVLNVVGFDTENGIVARGVVSRARNEVALDLAEQEYAGSMFKNGALPLGLIKHPWINDDEQRANFRADINSMHQGRENWNKIGFLWDKDADWMPLNFNPKDVQAIESRGFTAKAICRYYNVPPAIVQIFDDFKFSTVEAMIKQFVMLGIRPLAVCFERAIKSQIFNGVIADSDLFLEFAIEGLLRGDPKAQAETAGILRQWGFINADEVRQRDLNMNPIPGGAGSVYLAPLNYGPLDVVAAGGSTAGAGTDDGGEPNATRRPKAGPKRATWKKAFVAALALASKANRGGEAGNHASVALQIESREAFAWRVIRKQAGRMIENECRAIRRRVKDGPGKFLAWIDEHYAKFSVAMAEAIVVGCEGLVCDAESKARQIASAHCAESGKLLVKACDVAPEDFEQAIESCIANWSERANEIVETEYEAAA